MNILKVSEYIMERNVKTVAIILAGGSGTRFGSDVPKQFTKLSGRTILERTIDIFEKSNSIDEIIIVSISDYFFHISNMINNNKWKKIKSIVAGGNSRVESTLSALNEISKYQYSDANILIHDAVRPFVSEKILSACVEALQKFPAVDTAIPSSDTIVVVDHESMASAFPDRSTLRRGQTPQGFHLNLLQKAYDKIREGTDFNTFTCDCGVVKSMFPDVNMAVVHGDERNIKITNPIDIFMAETLIYMDKENIDFKEDLKNLEGKNIVIFGGRSGIGKSIRDIAMSYGANTFSASRSENAVDVSDIKSISSFLEKIREKVGTIDAVINTSGIMFREEFSLSSYQKIQEMVDTNYMGTINVALMSRQHLLHSQGCLINFSSSSYTRGRSLYAVYSSTKAAVVNISQALSEEWQEDGIRVHCICPERTDTPMRIQNFGVETPSTLLSPDAVARKTLQTLLLPETGLIVGVKLSLDEKN